MKQSFLVIGTMSGSSLDGLDIAACRFTEQDGKWSYEIEQADCIPFDDKWFTRLGNLSFQDALTLSKTHTYFGHYMGDRINDFIEANKLKDQVDLIASHGHTIFHNPKERLSVQIGCGAALAAKTSCTVANDFRTMDMALGGQGAPMVPIAEKYLFPKQQAFLNLGGIANLSIKAQDSVLAYDVCYFNQVLNFLAGLKSLEYDKDGHLAQQGKADPQLLEQLDSPYYQLQGAKSLSNQGLSDRLKVYMAEEKKPEDLLATAVTHKVQILHSAFEKHFAKNKASVLVSGGGAHNSYFMDCLNDHPTLSFELPNKNLIDFKEALCIAFAGLLRLRKEPNFLHSVTGADRDSIGGAIYLGK